MSSKGLTKSPATAAFKSAVAVKKITQGPKTVGVRMSRDEAVKLAHLLLSASLDDRCAGDVVITGHREHDRLTVLRYIKKKRVKTGQI